MLTYPFYLLSKPNRPIVRDTCCKGTLFPLPASPAVILPSKNGQCPAIPFHPAQAFDYFQLFGHLVFLLAQLLACALQRHPLLVDQEEYLPDNLDVILRIKTGTFPAALPD